jgi:hypothetical protein
MPTHFASAASPREDGRIAVFVRIRPKVPADAEFEMAGFASDACVAASPDARSLMLHRPFLDSRSFGGFHAVLPPAASQAQTYDSVAAPLVVAVAGGVSATLLAYGATGSGKSFTCFGGSCSASRDVDAWAGMLQAKGAAELPLSAGVVPRAVHHLFALLGEAHGNRAAPSTSDPSSSFTVTVSMTQLYAERLQDLLAVGGQRPAQSDAGAVACGDARAGTGSRTGGAIAGAGSGHHHRRGSSLSVREAADGSLFVEGLTHVRVASPQQALLAISEGVAGRYTAPTRANDTSSRSHALLQFTVDVMSPVAAAPASFGASSSARPYGPAQAGASAAPATLVTVTRSVLTIVDLAGCERLSKSDAHPTVRLVLTQQASFRS